MIIKLQPPLNPHEAPWLAYNEDNTIRVFLQQSEVPRTVRRAMGADFKGYFEATLSNGALRIGPRVGEQDW